jgi:uncharacterized RDD family membrane protein YckC
MTKPSGWYDDPQDPSLLRYWDGVVWSAHVTPKVSPTVERSNIGMPYGVTPAAARPQAPGSQGAQGFPAPGGLGPHQQDQGQGQQGGQWPAYGQGPGQFAAQPAGWQPHAATTPDGVELSGWWLRVGARLLDQLFTFMLALPFTGWFYYRYFVEAFEWLDDVAAETTAGSPPIVVFPPWEVLQWILAAGIIWFLIAAAYEVFFLSRTGATPGKKIVGISVRLRDRAGPPPMKAVLGRTACYYGFWVIGVATSIAYLLDVLWPLWDDKKQALHDKVAGTNVVVGPQPKRDV